MKIVLPGGAGHLGRLLSRSLSATGAEIVVISRRPAADERWRTVPWDAMPAEIEGSDLVINLAGRSVNCRYTPSHRREILDSRVASTRAVGEAIARAAKPPATWLQMSTATIYAHRYDAANDEISGRIGGDEPDAPETWRFSIEVARAWERTFDEIATPGTRKVALRSAIVMWPGRGGPFDVLHTLAKLRLGGASGDGRQFVSWIHGADFVRAITWIREHDGITGAINLASPNPLPNAAFMRELREASGIRFGLPSPAWLLEIGAVFMRTETELVLKSRRVVPARLLQTGFSFSFPSWPGAVGDLVQRARVRTA
jgi:hypothetical protein